MQPNFGFREHAHTADWELEVWAPDLPSLLEQAARGMYALSGVKTNPELQLQRSLAIQSMDAEGLLVRLLTELLWLEQEDGVAFDHFIFSIDDNFNLCAELCGSPITNIDKEIKAVTYHNLHVETAANGLHVNIVFDV
jgi:protein archease